MRKNRNTYKDIQLKSNISPFFKPNRWYYFDLSLHTYHYSDENIKKIYLEVKNILRTTKTVDNVIIIDN